MKLLLLSALPLLASANPVTLNDRAASKTCSINSQAVVNCRAGPSRSYSIVRTAQPEQRLGIECITDGEPIDAEKAWGYVPSWDCWLSIRWTDLGCKRALPTCT
ncbi:hypothetical protein QBC34DRAFT_411557 [Podospora aff. communis PSN243]|uniref:Uncharacterized protein n=1 Tax=Podospora aff. communis PSN243 TaxID=3040156 RepID=A0AAV9GE07_9PEZI|nr:hypothetical protein QBC34DRAFT_411557 [Podospora aff. communis PSN243]